MMDRFAKIEGLRGTIMEAEFVRARSSLPPVVWEAVFCESLVENIFVFALVSGDIDPTNERLPVLLIPGVGDIGPCPPTMKLLVTFLPNLEVYGLIYSFFR
jgi:hypothetical protein